VVVALDPSAERTHVPYRDSKLTRILQGRLVAVVIVVVVVVIVIVVVVVVVVVVAQSHSVPTNDILSYPPSLLPILFFPV